MKLIKNFVDHLSQYTPLEEIEKSESESIFKLLYPKRLKVGYLFSLLRKVISILKKIPIQKRFEEIYKIYLGEREVQNLERISEDLENADIEEAISCCNTQNSYNSNDCDILDEKSDDQNVNGSEESKFCETDQLSIKSFINSTLQSMHWSNLRGGKISTPKTFTLIRWMSCHFALDHFVKFKRVLMDKGSIIYILTGKESINESNPFYFVSSFLLNHPKIWSFMISLHFVTGIVIKVKNIFEKDSANISVICLPNLYRLITQLLTADTTIKAEWQSDSSLCRNDICDIEDVIKFTSNIGLQISIELSQYLGHIMDFKTIISTLYEKTRLLNIQEESRGKSKTLREGDRL